MKNFFSGISTSSRHMWAILGKRYKRRHDLSLRGEEKVSPTRSPTNMAEWLQLMEQHVAQAPVVDIQRRNAIRNAIVTGGYHFDSMTVAQKFIEFETALMRCSSKK